MGNVRKQSTHLQVKVKSLSKTPETSLSCACLKVGILWSSCLWQPKNEFPGCVITLFLCYDDQCLLFAFSDLATWCVLKMEFSGSHLDTEYLSGSKLQWCHALSKPAQLSKAQDLKKKKKPKKLFIPSLRNWQPSKMIKLNGQRIWNFYILNI